MNDKLLTVDQVSEYLGVHRDTVYAMVRSGRLPAMQLGGRKASWRISESDLQAFVATRKAAAAADGQPDGGFSRRQENERNEFIRRQQRELADFQQQQADQRGIFETGQPLTARDGDETRDGRVITPS